MDFTCAGASFSRWRGALALAVVTGGRGPLLQGLDHQFMTLDETRTYSLPPNTQVISEPTACGRRPTTPGGRSQPASALTSDRASLPTTKGVPRGLGPFSLGDGFSLLLFLPGPHSHDPMQFPQGEHPGPAQGPHARHLHAHL